jgi:hypothetical protein
VEGSGRGIIWKVSDIAWRRLLQSGKLVSEPKHAANISLNETEMPTNLRDLHWRGVQTITRGISRTREEFQQFDLTQPIENNVYRRTVGQITLHHTQ